MNEKINTKTKEMTIAEKLFKLDRVKCDLEEILDEHHILYDDYGWDYYDCSLELYRVSSDYRLTEEGLSAIFDAGFSCVYLNHIDKWETHYSKMNKKGWRVSYPSKRNDGDTKMWTENADGEIIKQ